MLYYISHHDNRYDVYLFDFSCIYDEKKLTNNNTCWYRKKMDLERGPSVEGLIFIGKVVYSGFGVGSIGGCFDLHE